MKLIVFQTVTASKVITLFDKMKFAHFVDGVHLDDVQHLRKNFTKTPHRLVYIASYDPTKEGHGDINFGEVQDYENPKTPDFIIYFDEFEELDPSDWFFLQTYFERLFNGLELPMITRRREYLLETGVRSDEISWGIFVLLRNRELGIK